MSLRSRMARYARYLPAIDWEAVSSLGEGGTPLVKSVGIGPALGLQHLYFKLESCNPTGSYKDRFVVCELALRMAEGHKMCLATSSGNTGSALASYAARMGMECHIFVLEDTPDGKLMQMIAHGAHVHRVRRFGKDAVTSGGVQDALQRLCSSDVNTMVVSAYKFCPGGMAGVKTIAYEVVDELGAFPDHTFVQVGSGGLCASVAQGYLDLAGSGDRIGDASTGAGAGPASRAQVHVVQPNTNDTIVTPLRSGAQRARSVETGTKISGLAVLTDLDGTYAMGRVRATGGTGFLPSEDEVLATQRELLVKEGIYAEPAGATSVAGLIHAVNQGMIKPGQRVVCIISGHGFKDTASLPSPATHVDFIGVEDIEKVVNSRDERPSVGGSDAGV